MEQFKQGIVFTVATIIALLITGVYALLFAVSISTVVGVLIAVLWAANVIGIGFAKTLFVYSFIALFIIGWPLGMLRIIARLVAEQ